MKTGELILIIDDEVQIRRLLEITLGANGYRISEASTGKEGLALASQHQPDLVVLDLGLPDAEGFDILKRLRQWYERPVIILSVRNSEEDIVRGLDLGANDYLTKPFRAGELLARIRAAIRLNRAPANTPVLRFGNIAVDLDKRLVFKNDEIVRLTSTEFSILALLARNAGRVLTHGFILREIWGIGLVDQTQYLRVFVAQIRKKIEDNPSKPCLLLTESGIGYRFGN